MRGGTSTEEEEEPEVNLLLIIVLAGVLGVADRGVAWSFSEHDYCIENRVGERLDCLAAFYAYRATCISQRAFDRWIEHERADEDYALCSQDALDDRAWCRQHLDVCEEE